jgi:hypothetical protein
VVFSEGKKSFNAIYINIYVSIVYVHILKLRAKKERKKMTILAATKKEKYTLKNRMVI